MFSKGKQAALKCALSVGAAALCAFPSLAHAGSPIVSSAAVTASSNTRYGWFGLLDSRSQYGKGFLPEPFRVDESDLESELRFDYLHTAVGNSHSDVFFAEVEQRIGVVTVEVKVPYERNSDGGTITEGFSNINLGARCPIFQYVSKDGFVDDTFGVGIELGIPVHSTVSRNTELVPTVFNDLIVGNFTMQTVFGYSSVLGSGGGPEGEHGLHTFEYGVVLGYNIPHRVLPIPGLRALVPIFELSGATALNKADTGRNELLATIGFRANLNAVGRFQPRIGVGVVLPLDDGGRKAADWGLATSFSFDY